MTNTTQETPILTIYEAECRYRDQVAKELYDQSYDDLFHNEQRFGDREAGAVREEAEKRFNEWFADLQRLKIQQSQPVKSLQECKDEAAKIEGHHDWEHLDSMTYYGADYDRSWTKAAELYAQQFQPKTVSDEEIESGAIYDSGLSGLVPQLAFIVGAKWMREKLTGKQ